METYKGLMHFIIKSLFQELLKLNNNNKQNTRVVIAFERHSMKNYLMMNTYKGLMHFIIKSLFQELSKYAKNNRRVVIAFERHSMKNCLEEFAIKEACCEISKTAAELAMTNSVYLASFTNKMTHMYKCQTICDAGPDGIVTLSNKCVCNLARQTRTNGLTYSPDMSSILKDIDKYMMNTYLDDKAPAEYALIIFAHENFQSISALSPLHTRLFNNINAFGIMPLMLDWDMRAPYPKKPAKTKNQSNIAAAYSACLDTYDSFCKRINITSLCADIETGGVLAINNSEAMPETAIKHQYASLVVKQNESTQNSLTVASFSSCAKLTEAEAKEIFINDAKFKHFEHAYLINLSTHKIILTLVRETKALGG